MKVVIYEHKNTPGLHIQECGFDKYLDKRVAFLQEQEDIRVLYVFLSSLVLHIFTL